MENVLANAKSKLSLAVLPASFALGTVTALASETPSSGIDTVISAMTPALGLVTEVINLITGNPILLFFLAAGLVPVGFKIFKAAKSAAGGGKA